MQDKCVSDHKSAASLTSEKKQRKVVANSEGLLR